MPIEYTHRTQCGLKARILCTDYVHTSSKIDAPFCVVVAILGYDITGDESITMLTSDLKLGVNSKTPYLTEYSPWQDVAVDTPVWCREEDKSYPWRKLHFAGLNKDGRPTVWDEGCTSHSGKYRVMWHETTTANPITEQQT